MDSTNLDSELFIEFKSMGNDANFFIYPIAIVKGYMRLFLLNENVLLCGFLWVDEMKSLENEKSVYKVCT